MRTEIQKQLEIVLDFVERWNKFDKEKDVAQAAQDLYQLYIPSSDYKRKRAREAFNKWYANNREKKIKQSMDYQKLKRKKI